jgi:NAD(P)-dependent dehydrogenase (short-subunit alcohol dehydrogenase family)
MAGQVQGKVAIVTGGASGIGAACAELLASEGASVAVTDIDELRGPEVVARIRKAGGEAMFLHQDVTSEPRWIEVVAEVMKRYGRLDVLVSNAGIGIGAPSITEMSLEDWRRQTAINLDGVFLSGETLPAGDAQDQRRLRHHDVVAGWPARLGQSCRLLRDQGRRQAVRKGDRDGMRDVR